MDELTHKRCKPCEGLTQKMTRAQAEAMLHDIPDWALDAEKDIISRRFEFKNFYKTMAFVNAVAWIANQEGHHPDMKVGYNYCEISFHTHAINGLSENDFICAAKISLLIETPA